MEKQITFRVPQFKYEFFKVSIARIAENDNNNKYIHQFDSFRTMVIRITIPMNTTNLSYIGRRRTLCQRGMKILPEYTK